jgi:hypothetical protein
MEEFKFFLGKLELRNGDVVSQSEIHKSTILSISVPARITNYTQIVANLSTQELIQFFHLRPNVSPQFFSKHIQGARTVPGIYTVYVFDSFGINYPNLQEFPVKNYTFNDVKSNSLGKLLAKITYIVRPNYKIDLSKFNEIYKFPRELIQKILLHGDFDVYEITYLCQRDHAINQRICQDPYFWQQYASTRLSSNLSMEKEQIISALKLTNYLQYEELFSTPLGVLSRVINYDIWMKKIISEKDNNLFDLVDIYARNASYHHQLPLLLSYFPQDLLVKYVTTYLVQLDQEFEDLIGGTPENYRYLVEKVIEVLDHPHFI